MKSWNSLLKEESEKDYFKDIIARVQQDSKTTEVYPPQKQIFTAFKLTPFNEVKCLILGQDAYHGPGQAHGLSFSVPHGVAVPPSLKNIFKELKSDLGIDPPNHGNLESWAKQGALLLNSSLTVCKGQPGSHSKIGWENLLARVLNELSLLDKPIVYLLWGKHAQAQSKYIYQNNKQLVSYAAHPSPLAGGAFFGSKPFSKTNQFLTDSGIDPIDWKIL